MVILYPIGSFYPAQSGGPNNSVYWLTTALKLRGINSIIVTTNEGLKSNSGILYNKWIDTDYGKIIYNRTRVHQFAVKMIYHSVKQMKKADIVHLTSISYLPSIIIATIALLKNKKIIWSSRGELEVYARNKHLFFKNLRFNYIRWLFKNNTTFHSTSDVETNNIRIHLACENVIQIPNYLRIPQIKIAPPKKQFLYLGRIDPIKAIESIIEGLYLSKRFIISDYIFIIAGSGDESYLRFLKSRINDYDLNDKIHFIGHIAGEEKEILYASSYFTLLLSHSENFGNVVLESLSQGTPVIASTGTPWQDLETYKAGFWIKNTPVKIAETIDKTLSLTADEYNIYKSNSRDFVESHFDIEKKADNWIRAYQKVIDNSQNESKKIAISHDKFCKSYDEYY